MDDDRLDSPSGSALPSFLLPALTVVTSLAVGAIGGAALTFFLARQPPEVVHEVRPPTAAELQVACAPIVEQTAKSIEEAQAKVDNLETRVAAKSAQVQEMQDEMNRRAASGKLLVAERNALQKELDRAQSELTSLTAKLAAAVEEKEALVVELMVTKQELVVKKEEARVARNDSLENKWVTFKARAQLAMCEKGRRKKLGKCREKVESELNGELGRKYVHCIRSGQSVPSLHELGKNETLPQFAEYLDQESKVTHNWYILLCDPTLPEAPDLKQVEHLLKADDWGSDLDNYQAPKGEDLLPEEAPAPDGALDVDLDVLPEKGSDVNLDTLDP